MRPPEELYTVHSEPSSADRPVLVYAFAGFVDAGAGVRLAAEHVGDKGFEPFRVADELAQVLGDELFFRQEAVE